MQRVKYAFTASRSASLPCEPLMYVHCLVAGHEQQIQNAHRGISRRKKLRILRISLRTYSTRMPAALNFSGLDVGFCRRAAECSGPRQGFSNIAIRRSLFLPPIPSLDERTNPVCSMCKARANAILKSTVKSASGVLAQRKTLRAVARTP